MNIAADKAVDVDKIQNAVYNKQPNIIADKAVILIKTKWQS